MLLLYPSWFAQSLIGKESPTTRRPCAYFSGISTDFTNIYIFDCAAWLGHVMPRGPFLRRFLFIQSARLRL